MKISLIDNGFDSLRKGYSRLAHHEELVLDGAPDAKRFSALKDAIVSIQHGVEILFKYVLRDSNELLLYSDISKLKDAYVRRRDGEITDLYEVDGVHTISFRESVERIIKICNVAIDKDFKERLDKVEKWRNKITHSALIEVNVDVAKVLIDLLADLDRVLAPIIGDEYIKGQGRMELERAYNVTKNVFGKLQNKIKEQAIEGFISALKHVSISEVNAPGVIEICDLKKAKYIIDHLQDVIGLRFACATVNGHEFTDFKFFFKEENGECYMYSISSEIGYNFVFESAIIYIPVINNDMSPHLFIYNSGCDVVGASPIIEESMNYSLQRGWVDSEGCEIWESNVDEILTEVNDIEIIIPGHKSCLRFLSKGMIFCMSFEELRTINKHSVFFGSDALAPENIVASFNRVILKHQELQNGV